MALEEAELKIILDGVWSSTVGSATIFQCLFNALKLQPGIDGETLANDLKDQLQRFVITLPESSLAQETVKLANSLLEP